MKKGILKILLLIATTGTTVLGFSNGIERVEPLFWWVGMNEPRLQLMVHADNIGNCQPSLNYPGVSLQQYHQTDNPNYLFLDLHVSASARPGSLEITFQRDQTTVFRYQYQLYDRDHNSAGRKGLDASDAVYLITPDRFANGDTSNDSIATLRQGPDRKDPGGRHGGDIQGIIDRLDYIKEMGFTAIWINPLLENDMEEYSYHGYSTTDYYRIDHRLGTNELYRELARKANDLGIKLIMDQVVNHCGSGHWWMNDVPSKDWINYPDEFVPTNHAKSSIQDPYVSQVDYKNFINGWFVETMPDLNHQNRLLANYLIQNSIWWIEYGKLSGIRQDTYSYSHQDFMAEWTCRIMDEYPKFYVVGEEWHNNPANVAFWQRDKVNPNGYSSCLPGIMDFPLQEALKKGLPMDDSVGNGLLLVYETLASDYHYADPYSLMVFVDNHDIERYYTLMGEDLGLYKLGLAYILAIRGIPQIYYGTEVLMVSQDNNDGIKRSDFPGGWPGDSIDAVSGRGLNKHQLEAQKFLKQLLNWRKGTSCIHHGKVLHYRPENGVYVVFRYDQDQRVMVVLNKNQQPHELSMDFYAEGLDGLSTGIDIFSGECLDLSQVLTVPPRTPLVLELQ